MSARVRYAPSPTGSPHVGNLRTAVYDWLLARKTGGAFVARLEDTDRDPTRYKPEFIGDIEQSLAWLGVTPDEWWVSGGDYGPYVQSERLPLYQEAGRRLMDMGMAYRCFCTEERLAAMREAQQAAGSPTGYDRHCRGLSREGADAKAAAGAPFTVRLAVPREGLTTYRDTVYGDITFENRNVDDQVLLKSNGWPTYHLGVVVDDHHMGITHVIRGEDWMPSTPKQVLIYDALQWPQPAWVHIPLTLGRDRKKLGKRHGSTQFVDFIRQGYLPDAMFNFLVLLGWSPGDDRQIMSREEIIEAFSLEGISRNPAVFDYDKLRWMNGEYIRAADPQRIAALCLPYLREAGLMSGSPTEAEAAYVAAVIPLVADRLKVLSEIADASRYFFEEPSEAEPKGRRKWLTGSEGAARLERILDAFAAAPDPLTPEAAEQIIDALPGEGESRAPFIHTTRIAATGATAGPGLFELLSVLGKARVMARLQRAREWVAEA